MPNEAGSNVAAIPRGNGILCHYGQTVQSYTLASKNMYYSSRIRGQTVPQNLYPSYVCAISPDVAKSPPPTHRPQHRMSPPRRTPAASPPLSMESSSMAPNHGAEAPHESDAGARWRGLVLATLLPLVLGAQTRPMENESGGRGLAIMWPPFV